MSLDKKRVIIDIVKDYLETWIELDRVPNQFMEKSTINMDDKDVVYLLGSSIYLELSSEEYGGELKSKAVKEPRVYQFLKRVLEKDRDIRESNPKVLLDALEDDKRDSIEILKSEDGYSLECFSSVGLTRLVNQDYLGYYQFENATLLIVADGVGGANGGEIASRLTTEFIIESLKRYNLSNIDISETLRDILFNANQEVLSYAKEHNMGQMGTTVSMALIVEQQKLYIAHVGDSRIYEFDHTKRPRQITQDHSEVEILYRTEVISKEDKKNYKKNILRYAIGLDNLKREDIFIQYAYLSGEVNLLLCSDGFWEKIDIDDTIFCRKFDRLKEDIYNSIPSDNVTFIRYSSSSEIDGCELSVLPFEDEFIEDDEVKRETKFIKKPKRDSRVSKDRFKPIEKINRFLIKFIPILFTFFAIYFIFYIFYKDKIRESRVISQKSELNTTYSKKLNREKNSTTKELKKRKLLEEIDKTQLRLKELKAQYQRLIN